ncbi:hypothetical protein ScPMuIL_005393 [Solemya velum]
MEYAMFAATLLAIVYRTDSILSIGVIEMPNASSLQLISNSSRQVIFREYADSVEYYDVLNTALMLETRGIDVLFTDGNYYATTIPGWIKMTPYFNLTPHIRNELPILPILVSACPTESSETLHDGNRLLIEALVTVIVHDQWSAAAVLFDRTSEYDATMLTVQLHSKGIATIMYDVSSPSFSADLLLDVYKEMTPSKANFLLLCGHELATSLLTQANRLSLEQKRRSEIGHFARWLVVTDSSEDFTNLYFTDWEINNIALVSIRNTKMQNFDVTPDLIVDENGCGTDISKFLQVQICSIHRVISSIKTLIWTDEGRQLSTVKYVYSHESIVMASDLFPNVNNAFNRRKLTVATHLWYPFVMKKSENNRTSYYGFCIELLDMLSLALNFTYDCVEPSDGDWGKVSNGTWTGLVGQLQRLEVDMVIAPLAMMSEREVVMDFVPVTYYQDYTSVMLKRLDPNLTKWRTLSDPLSWEVHLCILISLPILAMFTYIVEKVNPYYHTRKEVSASTRENVDIFWFFVAALFMEGGNYVPASLTGRTIVSVWWIYCTIIVGVYCGNLIAFLSVPKLDLPFNSLEEMTAQSEYTWGTLGGTNFEQVLKNSKLEVYRKMWEGIVRFNSTDPDVLHQQSGVHMDKVSRGGYAFIGTDTDGDTHGGGLPAFNP